MSKRKRADQQKENIVNDRQIEQNANNIADDCYKYIKNVAEIIYESEEQRKVSIIQQASYMQTAFSFVIAAVFMVTPVMLEHRGNLSETFFFIAVSSISFFLIASLFFATMAQNRRMQKVYPTIEAICNKIEDEYKQFQSAAARDKYLVEIYKELHTSLEKGNGRRVQWIRLSMSMFYIALALCIFWYIVAVVKIF